MAKTKPVEDSGFRRLRVSELRDRKIPRVRTGLSPFMLWHYVTARQSLSPTKLRYIEGQLANNPYAREEYERMQSEASDPPS